MGQAFRRASGKIRTSSSIDSTSSSSKSKTVADLRPPPGPTIREEIPRTVKPEGALDSVTDGTLRSDPDNVLEERDPKYDAMLGQMVGRIQSKPGGKLEMGEAFVVEKYNRPLPKLRDTKPDSGKYEERPTSAGTLNVAQLRHIILLHEGKAEDHKGPMDIPQIADKFRVDVAQIQKLLQFTSLPTEDSSKQKNV